MVFDLRRALLAKEERESARLMEFEFRLRARAMRLLAIKIGHDPDDIAGLVAAGDDEAVIAMLQPLYPELELVDLLAKARLEERHKLVNDIGDPAPHSLA